MKKWTLLLFLYFFLICSYLSSTGRHYQTWILDECQIIMSFLAINTNSIPFHSSTVLWHSIFNQCVDQVFPLMSRAFKKFKIHRNFLFCFDKCCENTLKPNDKKKIILYISPQGEHRSSWNLFGSTLLPYKFKFKFS